MTDKGACQQKGLVQSLSLQNSVFACLTSAAHFFFSSYADFWQIYVELVILLVVNNEDMLF
jgi:hypothetical protein